MESNVQTNIDILIKHLNEYRLDQKYCDVKVKVDGVHFKCHKVILAAASGFFDRMFSGQFKEGSAKKIKLKEISSSTFEAILQFIYTGDVTITESNVFGLVRASELYELPGLETLCILYIEQNPQRLSADNALDMYMLARVTNRTNVIECLRKHIVKHFNHLYRTSKFTEFSFEDLKHILCGLPSEKHNSSHDVFVEGIIRWTQTASHGNYTQQERRQFFDSLISQIDLSTLSPEYMEHFIKRYVGTCIIKPESNRSTSCSCDVFGSLCGDATAPSASSSTAQLIHIYVKKMNASGQPFINAYRLSKRFEQGSSVCWSFSCDLGSFDFMKCVTIDDSVYSLTWRYNGPSKSTVFIPNPKRRRISNTPVQQTFSVSNCVSLFQNTRLKLPPSTFRNYDMCGMDKSIYLYNKNMCARTPPASNENQQSDVVVPGGFSRWHDVYVYDRGTDSWSSIPHPKTEVVDGCIACLDGILYLMGGNGKGVQWYDHRTGEWSEPTIAGKHKFFNAACCVQNGSIYVCGGSQNSNIVDVYDPIAAKWRYDMPPMLNGRTNHHLLTFRASLLVFSETISSKCPYGEVYGGKRREWFAMPFQDTDHLTGVTNTVMDAIFSRPYGY